MTKAVTAVSPSEVALAVAPGGKHGVVSTEHAGERGQADVQSPGGALGRLARRLALGAHLGGHVAHTR